MYLKNEPITRRAVQQSNQGIVELAEKAYDQWSRVHPHETLCLLEMLGPLLRLDCDLQGREAIEYLEPLMAAVPGVHLRRVYGFTPPVWLLLLRLMPLHLMAPPRDADIMLATAEAFTQHSRRTNPGPDALLIDVWSYLQGDGLQIVLRILSGARWFQLLRGTQLSVTLGATLECRRYPSFSIVFLRGPSPQESPGPSDPGSMSGNTLLASLIRWLRSCSSHSQNFA